MTQKECVDFTFRYRPLSDSPDGILIRYLQSYKPSERRNMILRALRAFYLVAAYGDKGELDTVEQLSEFSRLLEKTYGEGADGSIKHSLSLDIQLKYCGFQDLPGGFDDDD